MVLVLDIVLSILLYHFYYYKQTLLIIMNQSMNFVDKKGILRVIS